MRKFKGRPILGAISGLFFGLWVSVLLMSFSIRPLDTLSVFGLPILGLAIGLVVAWFAPFGRGKTAPDEPA
jgi:hypothetical protein